MLKQVCFYCNADLGSVEVTGDQSERISHGVCPECFPKFVAGTGERFEAFLDSLPVPVLIVDRKGCIEAMNSLGRELLPGDFGPVKGRPGGEVFSCKYATYPEGCGQTIHCKTCTIRRTVLATLDTGMPALKVPAYVDLGDLTGVKSIRYLISTKKIGPQLSENLCCFLDFDPI